MTDQSPSARALSGGQIARAAGIVMLAFVVSAVLGIVRQSAINATFGAGAKLDAFMAAQRVPETLFVLVAGGALGSAFIPVFTRFLALDDAAGRAAARQRRDHAADRGVDAAGRDRVCAGRSAGALSARPGCGAQHAGYSPPS